jgi:transposase
LRGSDERTGSLFSYVDLEARVRKDHPLRPIRLIVNETLSTMERDFAALYAGIGRPSVAPEMLLRAMLLQVFYSVRSERQLMERLEFDLLFRWFVGIGIDEPVWDHSTFSKNRDRLLEGAIAASFLSSLLAQPKVKRLLSSEHFSVDGTLIQAWASMKSFKPMEGPQEPPPPTGGGRNAEANFRGETRSNATHASTTDPDAKLSSSEARYSTAGDIIRPSNPLLGIEFGQVGLATTGKAIEHCCRRSGSAAMRKKPTGSYKRARGHAGLPSEESVADFSLSMSATAIVVRLCATPSM